MLRNINTMLTTSELADVLTRNAKFVDHCYYTYAADVVEIDLEEYLFNAPFTVEGGGVYSYSVRLDTMTIAKIYALVDWFHDNEYSLYWDDDKSPIQAVERWSELVIRRDYELYTDDLSPENWRRLEGRIEELEDTIKSAIIGGLDCISDQFDDYDYLADMLISMEYLTDYYIDDSGNIFRYREPLERIA